MRDHNAIIGRWSLSWNLLSKQARSRSEANKDLPVSRVAGEPSDAQRIVLLTAMVDSLRCWTVRDYGNTSRSQGAAAARVHMTRCYDLNLLDTV